MAKKNGWGGPRPGAGRPPKADEIELIEKLGPLEPIAFEALKKKLGEADTAAVKLFFEYRFGKPKQSVDVTSKGDRIFEVAFLNVGSSEDNVEADG